MHDFNFVSTSCFRQGTGKYVPSDIDPDLCTHVIYGFAVLDAEQLVIKPHDTWADYDNSNNFNELTSKTCTFVYKNSLQFLDGG